MGPSSSQAFFRISSRRPVMITRAPVSTNTLAIPSPSPVPPPVIRASFLSRVKKSVICFGHLQGLGSGVIFRNHVRNLPVGHGSLCEELNVFCGYLRKMRFVSDFVFIRNNHFPAFRDFLKFHSGVVGLD